MDNTVAILGKLMDSTMLRQKALSNNLANANTPGYIRKDVHFGEALSNAIGRGRESIEKVRPEVIDDQNAPTDAKGNSVSLQKELAAIAQNELLYDFATQMTSQKMGLLRKAVTGTK